MTTIQLAETDGQIQRCFAVMAELRTHLIEGEFLERIRRQQREGYRLVCLEDDGAVKALAGYRISECLFRGKFMYVDDLITTAAGRSKGYGRQLFAWLLAEAKAADCGELSLDSGVQRFDAHRFYLRHRMDIIAHHFRLKLR